MNNGRDREDAQDQLMRKGTVITTDETTETADHSKSDTNIGTAAKPADARGTISIKAWEILSEGARNNSEIENTVVSAALEWETPNLPPEARGLGPAAGSGPVAQEGEGTLHQHER